MKVLVTGATGFIGGALCARLNEMSDVDVIASVRSPEQVRVPAGQVAVRDLAADTDWRELLQDVDIVVHTAAKVHEADNADSIDEYRQTNVDGTLALARQAASIGVKRFVFLSSVKVNGEATRPGQAYRADDPPAPVDAYGRSKHEAETALQALSEEQPMEVVVIRSPLVYGPGVRANFLALMRWVSRGYPLPLASVHNARSLVALDNLVDLVWTCCIRPEAANEIIMAADGEDVSTAELVRRLGHALGRPARLIACPPKLLLMLAAVAGKAEQANKLLANLQVDIGKTRELLDWAPVTGMEQALQATAQHFVEGQQ
ncbi:MAG: SDR family oxidoreductase [Woeseiaceae bacterium]|nr:SDR family oxidoreductase [Woeseiaceae bacterium]